MSLMMSKSRKRISEGSSSEAKRNPLEFKLAEFRNLLKSKTTIVQGLTSFIKSAHDKLIEADFLSTYLHQSPECKELVLLLDDQTSYQHMQLVFECLEFCLLHCGSTGNDLHNIGVQLARKLLLSYGKRLYYGIGHSYALVKATLRMLAAMVAQGVTIAREMLRSFDFTLKSLQTLANKRNLKESEDARVCYIKFCLSFIISGDAAIITKVMETKVLLSSIFKGLPLDRIEVVYLFLSMLRQQVVCNKGISKKAKVAFFNSYSLGQIARLFDRRGEQIEIIDESDDDITESRLTPLEQFVRGILMELCCSHQTGIAFHCKQPISPGRTNNPVLLRFVNQLSAPWEDALLSDLIVRILTTCPDLVHPFFGRSLLTLEPRASHSWFSLINFLMKVLTDVTSHTVVMKAGIPYHPNKLVPYIKSLISPPLVSRAALARGIQHKIEAIRYACVTLLFVILKKALEVKTACDRIAHDDERWGNSKDSIPTEGTFLYEFLEEIRKMLPDINILISARHKATSALSCSDQIMSVCLEEDDLTIACMTLDMSVHPVQYVVRILKAMVCYQSLLPDSFVSVGYDLGKLIQDSTLLTGGSSVQLVVLELLEGSHPDTFRWLEAGTHDVLVSVLELVLSSSTKVSVAALSLLKKMLLQTGLFDHNPNEVFIWLEQLAHLHTYRKKEVSLDILSWLAQIIKQTAKDPLSAIDEILTVQSEMHHSTAITMDRKTMFEVDAVMNTEDVHEELTVDGVSGSFSGLQFTPLLVTALHQYTMVLQQALTTSAVFPEWSLATFVGSVVLCTLHTLSDMQTLGHIVTQSYSVPFVSDLDDTRRQSLATDAGLFYHQHMHVLQYVLCWTRGPHRQLKVRVSQINGKKRLKAAMSNKKEGCDSLLQREFYRVLMSLTRADFQDVLSDLVDFCQTIGDLSPIVLYMHTYPGSLSGVANIPSNVLEALSTSSSLHSMLIAFAVQWTPKTNFITIELPSSTVQEFLINLISNMSAHTLHRSASTTLSLLTHLALTLQINFGLDKVFAFTFYLTLLERLVERLVKSAEDEQCVLQVMEALLGNEAITGIISLDTTSETKASDKHQSANTTANIQLSKLQIALASSFANILEVTKPVYTGKTMVEDRAQQVARTLTDMLTKWHWKDNRTSLMSRLTQHVGEQYIYSLTDRLLQGRLKSVCVDATDHVDSDCLLSLLSTSRSPLSAVEFRTFLKLVVTRPYEQECKAAQTLQSFVEGCNNTNTTSIDYSLLVDKKSFDVLLKCCGNAAVGQLCAMLVRCNPVLGHQFGEWCCIMLSRTSGSSDTLLLQSKRQLIETNRLDIFPVISAFFQRKYCSWHIEGKHNQKAKQLLIKHYWPIISEELCHSSCDKTQNLCCQLLSVMLPFMQTRSKHIKKQFELLENLCYCMHSRCAVKSAEMLAASLVDLSHWNGAVTFVVTCMKLLTHCWNDGNDMTHSCSVLDETKLVDILTTWSDKLLQASSQGLVTIIESLASAWADFVHSSLRERFGSAGVLRLLSSFVRLLYGDHNSGQMVDGISLSSLYKRFITDSRLFSILLRKADVDVTEGSRESLIELIYNIAEVCPTTQSTETALLCLVAYSPHLTYHNILLLKLMTDCEKQGANLQTASPYLWGERALELVNLQRQGATSLYTKPGPQEVLELFSSSTLVQSALKFPIQRILNLSQGSSVTDDLMPHLYDPCFLLPLFSHMLQPGYQVPCRKFADQGALAFVLTSLASVDAGMRAAGYHVLSEYSSHLEGDQFREKAQVQHLLLSLANAVSEPNMRIPFITACFLAKASQIILKPEHPIYGHVNKALLRRPTFSLFNIPEFYELFNSSSLEHKTERKWMLQLLCDGLRDENDYRIYCKRHVLELAMSFHNSPLSDGASQDAILELVKTACSLRKAAIDLCRKHGLLSWCHGIMLCRDQQLHKVGKVISIMLRLVSTFKTTGSFVVSSLQEIVWVCTTVLGLLSYKIPLFERFLSELLDVLNTVISLMESTEITLPSHLVERLIDKGLLVLSARQLHDNTADQIESQPCVLVGRVISLSLCWKQLDWSVISRILDLFKNLCQSVPSKSQTSLSYQIACWLSQLLEDNTRLHDFVLQEEDSNTVNTVQDFVLVAQQQGLQGLLDRATYLLQLLTQRLLNEDLNDDVLSSKCHRVKLLAKSSCYKAFLEDIFISLKDSSESTAMILRLLWSETDPEYVTEFLQSEKS